LSMGSWAGIRVGHSQKKFGNAVLIIIRGIGEDIKALDKKVRGDYIIESLMIILEMIASGLYKGRKLEKHYAALNKVYVSGVLHGVKVGEIGTQDSALRVLANLSWYIKEKDLDFWIGELEDERHFNHAFRRIWEIDYEKASRFLPSFVSHYCKGGNAENLAGEISRYLTKSREMFVFCEDKIRLSRERLESFANCVKGLAREEKEFLLKALAYPLKKDDFEFVKSRILNQ